MNVRNVMNTQNESVEQYRDTKIYIEDRDISDADVELPNNLENFEVKNSVVAANIN